MLSVVADKSKTSALRDVCNGSVEVLSSVRLSQHVPHGRSHGSFDTTHLSADGLDGQAEHTGHIALVCEFESGPGRSPHQDSVENKLVLVSGVNASGVAKLLREELTAVEAHVTSASSVYATPSGWSEGSRSLMSTSKPCCHLPSCSAAQSTVTTCWEPGARLPMQGDREKPPVPCKHESGGVVVVSHLSRLRVLLDGLASHFDPGTCGFLRVAFEGHLPPRAPGTRGHKPPFIMDIFKQTDTGEDQGAKVEVTCSLQDTGRAVLLCSVTLRLSHLEGRKRNVLLKWNSLLSSSSSGRTPQQERLMSNGPNSKYPGLTAYVFRSTSTICGTLVLLAKRVLGKSRRGLSEEPCNRDERDRSEPFALVLLF
ncbi:hypothetical protein EYF80_049173 [Liparis tanakae]|uniref:Uncharacterized protein n=1 Tax=Liparis tanakae TaxID=230148 RepID=A0A4Z2FHG2_9TELE|nr:hypothetical protein EYF80_049173 [Liparis tanakae]